MSPKEQIEIKIMDQQPIKGHVEVGYMPKHGWLHKCHVSLAAKISRSSFVGMSGTVV